MSGPPGYSQPVSAPPVSAPPWGLTAPPWSSSAPPHPLPPADVDPTDPGRTDIGEPTPGGETTPDGETTAASAAIVGDRSAAGGESLPIVNSTLSTVQGEPSGLASASTEVFPAVGPAPAPPRDATAGSVAPVTYPPATPTHPPAAQYPGSQQYPGQPYQHSHEVYPGQHYQQAAYSDPYTDEGGSTGRNRATLIGAAVAAGVALVAVAGLGVVVLNRDDAPPPPGAAVTATPSAAGPPPGDLKLRDDVATITLTWTDPSGGAVPFMVAGGRAGLALGVMATVEPGRTSHTVNGLSSRVDYCFTVLAVYSTDSFATSGQVCTNRERSTPPS
ncbi:fibronectin type III domain-containing protein [Micromonospora sp. DT43]|uniref:fibronectin type III domain-containing protein n=1 Tax=Micromonospora sp. DT43 TaxID=3393440 RepID=UPI003CEFD949